MIRKRIVQFVGLVVILGAASLSSSTVTSPQLGDPLPNLSASELQRFTAGLAVFSRDFTAQDGSGSTSTTRPAHSAMRLRSSAAPGRTKATSI